MVSGAEATPVTIARLEARVRTLEKALAARSLELRALTRDLCRPDVDTLSRMAAGLPPLPRAGIGLKGWRETTVLTGGDVERTLTLLWRSVVVPAPGAK